jgi:hypothetical protein
MSKPVKGHPVSDADAVVFHEHVEKWRALLNLRDWRIERSGKRDRRNMASVVAIEHEHKLAKYSLGLSFGGTPVTSHSLEHVAAHELLHVVLAPLIKAVADFGADSEEVAEREHAVIVLFTEMLMHAYGEPPPSSPTPKAR